MSKTDDMLYIGQYSERFNDILGIKFERLSIYRSKGLPTHILKQKHFKCLKYIDYLPEIIKCPDYIGINPNESEPSIEIIKRYKDNVMVGIKLGKDSDHFYVSTMYDIQDNKIERRLHSGRLKQYFVDTEEK